jgi:hypothetical protein
MVKMLQEKSVFEFDFVWKAGMSTWQRVAEVEQFGPDAIKKLKESGQEGISEVFFRRRHMRTEYNGSIIFHDNNRVWKGGSLEISEGGAGVVMNNAMILPGQTIYMHVKPGDGVPPFNAVCEVISKKYIKGISEKDAPLSYGIKFVSIDGEARTAIRSYVKERNKAA